MFLADTWSLLDDYLIKDGEHVSRRYMIIVRPQDPHLSLFSATLIVASVWLVGVIIVTILVIIVSSFWFLEDDVDEDDTSLSCLSLSPAP